LVLKKWNSNTKASEAIKLWEQTEPNDAVLARIEAIRRTGTTVALATNQNRFRADYMKRPLGYAERFDHILCSCDLGYAKPSIEYFKKSIDQIGIAAEQILFIDDGEANGDGARLVCINAQQFEIAEGIDALESILDSYALTDE